MREQIHLCHSLTIDFSRCSVANQSGLRHFDHNDIRRLNNAGHSAQLRCTRYKTILWVSAKIELRRAEALGHALSVANYRELMTLAVYMSAFAAKALFSRRTYRTSLSQIFHTNNSNSRVQLKGSTTLQQRRQKECS